MNIYQKYQQFYDMDWRNIPRPQPSDFAIEFFGHQTNLKFLDIGAHNGITWSNSLLLEEQYNWKGICIEANPKVFAELYKNRPNAINLNFGMHSKEQTKTFWKIDGYAEMLSGFEDSYDYRHIQRIHDEIKKYGGKINKIEIATKTIRSLMSHYDSKNFDYLSIDVEGAELDILKGIDFDNNSFSLISAENNGYSDDVRQFLENNGYRFLKRVCGDEFYEKRS